MSCPHSKSIPAGFYAESWIDDLPIAAVVEWASGHEYLWVDGHTMAMQDAMPPKEVIYNLKHLSPSERREAFLGIKQVAS